VLLPGVDTEKVQMALERVRNAVATAEPADGVYPLSISLGQTTCETPSRLFEAFKQADQRMYMEKAARKRSKA
jgi:GGDEF domain-containing protein